MSRREEREIAREYRRRPVIAPGARRDLIAEFARTLSDAAHREPALAAELLPRLWELHRQLDLSCLPVVCR